MLKRKITITILLLIMTLSLFMSPINVMAQNTNITAINIMKLEDEKDLKKFAEEIKYLSEPELQNIIDDLKIITEDRSTNSTVSLKGAWLAAAQIARVKGYPLSAKLVEHSVWGKDYDELNGNFAKAIRTTGVYKRIIRKGKGSDAFEKKDNRDLFYSIHKFDYTSSGGSQGIRIRIHDKFDFALDTTYKSLFSSIVNNWAYLNQNAGVLNRIDVLIYLDV